LAEHEHTLHAKVLTPEGQVFDGDVEQLSTRTKVGEIGVLANHVPVLARLRPTELRLHMPDGEVQRWAQAEGWLQVFANRATVLVGEAIRPEDLDTGALQERIKDAEGRLLEAEEGSGAYHQAERDKERAEAFIKVAEGAA
jgi:F-type H+-transporting ATPase subunit epsilon